MINIFFYTLEKRKYLILFLALNSMCNINDLFYIIKNVKVCRKTKLNIETCIYLFLKCHLKENVFKRNFNSSSLYCSNIVRKISLLATKLHFMPIYTFYAYPFIFEFANSAYIIHLLWILKFYLCSVDSWFLICS